MLLATPPLLRSEGPFVQVASAARLRPYRKRLPIPRPITSANFTLPMRQAEIQVLPGKKTKMWTYGGDFPGPTIRRPTGVATSVTFQHRLPKKAGELTVHLHGAHSPSSEDGQPGGLTRRQPRSLYCDISPELSARASGNNLLIQRGRQRTYEYPFVEEGEPERAAMHWYHDHRLDRTAKNVWKGLAGMWIADDDFDQSLPLPRGNREIPLMLSDRSFDRNNQLTNPFSAGAHAPNDGVTGKHILVNGAILPYQSVSACRHRLRVLNASNFRSYNLALTGGATITQIGTESGLMPRSLPRSRVLIGPGERVDLIVDFAPAANSRVELKSVGRPDGPDKRGSKSYQGPLMQFRVNSTVLNDPPVPTELRPLPDWVEEAPANAQRSWRISVGKGLRPPWLINGRTFDPDFVQAKPTLNTTETWKLVNATAVAHLMHPHHTDWYMLSRNGRTPAAHERCLKETFFLDPGDEILIAGRFSDYAGKYVIHCHMLDHEDHGLMSQFETVAP